MKPDSPRHRWPLHDAGTATGVTFFDPDGGRQRLDVRPGPTQQMRPRLPARLFAMGLAPTQRSSTGWLARW
jgi:hypothetical protein